MAVLTWPEGILPSSFDWDLKSNGSSFVSPWNGQSQTVRYPGSSWVASMTLSRLDDYESREIEALLYELDGMAGRIKLWDFGRDPATVLGTPTVNGANQTGSVLVTKGWNPSVKVLSRGDYITVKDELKLVLSDVTSSSTGLASIRIGPMLRDTPSDNLAIEVTRPYAVFRLENNTNGVKRSPGSSNDFSLSFVEAF